MLINLIDEKFTNLGLETDGQISSKWTDSVKKVYESESEQEEYIEHFYEALVSLKSTIFHENTLKHFNIALHDIYTLMCDFVVLPEEVPAIMRDLMYSNKSYMQIRMDLSEGKYLP